MHALLHPYYDYYRIRFEEVTALFMCVEDNSL